MKRIVSNACVKDPGSALALGGLGFAHAEGEPFAAYVPRLPNSASQQPRLAV
jgi:hypothetical protein